MPKISLANINPGFNLWVVFFSLLVQRLILIRLPFFSNQLAQYWLPNFLVGFASDLVLFFALWGVRNLISIRTRNSLIFRLVTTLFLIVWCFVIAAHVRYAEYFGSLATPNHLAKVFNPEAFFSGFENIFHSPYSVTQLLAPVLLGTSAWAFFYLRRAKFNSEPLVRRSYIQAVICLLIAAGFNGVSNKYKAKEFIHEELRFNFITSYYYKRSMARKYRLDDLGDSAAAFAQLRSEFPGERSWLVQGKQHEDFPLWQERLAKPAETSTDLPAHKIFNDLQKYVLEKQQTHGPWNIVFVLEESLRASFLEIDGGSWTPYLNRLKNEAIQFTETYSAGIETSIGQIASHCSLYTPPRYDFMFIAPTTPTICLGDIFSHKNYQNYFFYAGDNAFDRQETFYTQHRFNFIFGEKNYAPQTPRAGWGYSDHAMFELALTELSKAKQPFFATLLTLTNHSPFILPADAPAEIDRKQAIRQQVVQYVDWAFAKFYARLAETFPHTIVMLIADHGILTANDSLKKNLTEENFSAFRNVARIPWFIWIPNLPKELRGQAINNLSSNVDLAPTLLALLNSGEHAQQFVGMNAFRRSGPVWINWQDKFFSIQRTGASGFTISSLDSNLEKIYGAVVFNRMLAPLDNR